MMNATRTIVVAADGSGDFLTIQEAVNAVSDGRTEQTIIHVRNGVYEEKLHIEKPLIRLVGESADRTIVTYGDYALKVYPNGEPYHTFNSYTAFIGGDDFTAERIAFVNSAGRGEDVGQAVAVYVDGDRAAFKQCRFIGWQDTIFTGPLPLQPVDRGTFGGPREGMPRRHVRHYFEECYIEGDVDYIFGSATALLYRCELFTKDRLNGRDGVNGYITAGSTTEAAPFGYVFIECRLTGDAPSGSVYLGRPWREHAKTAFIDCWLGDLIIAEGWHNWGKWHSEATTDYVEYRCTGPGADPVRRVGWSRQLSDEEATVFNPAAILSGEDGWAPWDRAV